MQQAFWVAARRILISWPLFLLIGALSLFLFQSAGGVRGGRALAFEFPPEPEIPAAGRIYNLAQITGKGLRVWMERAQARPGDRYVEVWAEIDGKIVPPGQGRLRAKLFKVGGMRLLGKKSVVAESGQGRLLVDLKSVGLDRARLRLELLDAGKLIGAGDLFIERMPPRMRLAADTGIPVRIDPPADAGALANWPVTFGIPCPAGMIWDADTAGLRLRDAAGVTFPMQIEIAGRWARDGAVKWLRADALVSLGGGAAEYRVAYEPAPDGLPETPAPAGAVRVTALPDGVEVECGQARYLIGRGSSPIGEVWLAGRKLLSAAGGRGLYVELADDCPRVDDVGGPAVGGAMAADPEMTMEVESAGPVAASIRLAGRYLTPAGVELARHITRLEFTAGRDWVKITHTLILTRDSNEVWFKEIGWELAAAPGVEAQALFAVSRGDPGVVVETGVSEAGAYMVQSDHVLFGGGSNVCAVACGGDRIFAGDECGDWAALQGGAGGVLLACREAARQHPKEFAIFPDRVNLKMYSGRPGVPLDFRPAALLARWNRGGWIKDEAVQREIIETPCNAAGWSKTHELLLMPFTRAMPRPALMQVARLHSTPVFALADPEWLYRSEALGPLHPRDPLAFPDIEAFVDGAFAELLPLGAEQYQEYGFVDWFNGPHHTAFNSRASGGRYRLTYTLRPAMWLLYARSGDRRIREFAERVNRNFGDNHIAHWSAAGKIKGLYMEGGSPLFSSLPYYWASRASTTLSTSGNLNMFVLDYYLTGNRRARDVALQYGEGLKEWWRPGVREWRILVALRHAVQAYGFTWDPDLLAVAEGITRFVYDPQSEVKLTKDRPYSSSTYKTQSDVTGLIEAWELFGTERYREMALGLTRFWWDQELFGDPDLSRFERGRAGNFLYRQTGAPDIADTLAMALRRQAAGKERIGTSRAVFRFQDVAYAQDVLTRAGWRADAPGATWAGCDDFGGRSAFVTAKEKFDASEIVVRTPGAGMDGRLSVIPLGNITRLGVDLVSQREMYGGAITVRLPYDADAGAYMLQPRHAGVQFACCRPHRPLILYAPEYWRPEPLALAPMPRIYFKVPEDARAPQIFFEGGARLLAPDGAPYPDARPARGWVSLPADHPGLWSFVPESNHLVRVRNLPPFFAFDDPAAYFEPAIAWESVAPAVPAPAAPADTVFLPGAAGRPDDQALHLTGKRHFTVNAGAAGVVLPFEAGTIEFHFKPCWSTFELWPKATKTFWRMATDDKPWYLVYVLDPGRASYSSPEWRNSHVLETGIPATTGKDGRLTYWRGKTFFERDEWVHIAVTWGQIPAVTVRRNLEDRFDARIFVNGVKGTGLAWAKPNTHATCPPRSLTFGYGLNGMIDNLRISDIRRYDADFTPPLRAGTMDVDENTLALFRFDGNLAGVAFGRNDKIGGTLNE